MQADWHIQAVKNAIINFFMTLWELIYSHML